MKNLLILFLFSFFGFSSHLFADAGDETRTYLVYFSSFVNFEDSIKDKGYGNMTIGIQNTRVIFSQVNVNLGLLKITPKSQRELDQFNSWEREGKIKLLKTRKYWINIRGEKEVLILKNNPIPEEFFYGVWISTP